MNSTVKIPSFGAFSRSESGSDLNMICEDESVENDRKKSGESAKSTGSSRRSTPMPDAYVRPISRSSSFDTTLHRIPSISDADEICDSFRPSSLTDVRLAHLSEEDRCSVVCGVVAHLSSLQDWNAVSVYLAVVGNFMTEQSPDTISLSQIRQRLSDCIALCEQNLMKLRAEEAKPKPAEPPRAPSSTVRARLGRLLSRRPGH